MKINVFVLDIYFMEEWTEPQKSHECIGCLSICALCPNGMTLEYPDSRPFAFKHI